MMFKVPKPADKAAEAPTTAKAPAAELEAPQELPAEPEAPQELPAELAPTIPAWTPSDEEIAARKAARDKAIKGAKPAPFPTCKARVQKSIKAARAKVDRRQAAAEALGIKAPANEPKKKAKKPAKPAKK